MDKREKAAVFVAMILALPLGLLLEVAYVEASLAWDSYQRMASTGRDEAAAGYLIVVGIHRAVQILTAGVALSAAAFYVVLSRLRRRREVVSDDGSH